MGVAVKLDNVSKRFVLHHQRAHSFQDLFVGMFRRNGSREEFWALKDINFEIQKGQSVGIIGRNGSGKSTILKLITRILLPTSGAIITHGKISALLELGAGFHPDLTGRENIYLNGSLLGLSKKEMDRRYDEIVEFSELGHFIDTSVKHYSSGMYMRLGFSVAVAVDPDVLIADEVLAVGDARFQEKCIDKMHEFRRGNRTVVLVSHDLDTIRSFCDHIVWLDEGCLRERGTPDQIVDKYLTETGGSEKAAPAAAAPNLPKPEAAYVASPEPTVEEVVHRWGSREAEILEVQFSDATGEPTGLFETGKSLVVRIRYLAHARINRPVFGLAIYRDDGTHICGPNTRTSGVNIEAIEGQGCVEFVVEDLPLLEGKYLLTAAIYDWANLKPYDHHERLYSFSVVSPTTQERNGSVLLRSNWRMAAPASDFLQIGGFHG